jgi:hypothetical protein
VTHHTVLKGKVVMVMEVSMTPCRHKWGRGKAPYIFNIGTGYLHASAVLTPRKKP